MTRTGPPQKAMHPADIDIDLLVEAGAWPDEPVLAALASDAVTAAVAEISAVALGPVELSLVFSNDAQVKDLNARWRGKGSATNVLSFPAFPIVPGQELPPVLGDIVLAFETVRREAELETKPFEHHLTHLVVHGLLHLLGHDHEADDEAERMEALERRILARLAIPDPYA